MSIKTSKVIALTVFQKFLEKSTIMVLTVFQKIILKIYNCGSDYPAKFLKKIHNHGSEDHSKNTQKNYDYCFDDPSEKKILKNHVYGSNGPTQIALKSPRLWLWVSLKYFLKIDDFKMQNNGYKNIDDCGSDYPLKILDEGSDDPSNNPYKLHDYDPYDPSKNVFKNSR